MLQVQWHTKDNLSWGEAATDLCVSDGDDANAGRRKLLVHMNKVT